MLLILLCLGFGLQLTNARMDLEGMIEVPNSEKTLDTVTVTLETIAGTPVDRTFPNALGYFQFNGIALGSYYVRVEEPGFQHVRKMVRLPWTGNLVISLLPLFDTDNSNYKPFDGNYRVDLGELRMPPKAINEYEHGVRDGRAGNMKNAIKHLTKAIRIAPNYFSAHLALAREYEKVADVAAAENHYSKASELRPADPEPSYRLGEMHLRNENFRQAAAAFRLAGELDPRSARIAAQLGLAQFRMHEFEAAERSLLHAQQLAPGDPVVRLLLINVFLKQKKLANALQQSEGYLAENPNGDKRNQVQVIRTKLLKLIPMQ